MMFLSLFIFLIPVFIIIIFTPYWTRKTDSFGVSIPEKLYTREDIRDMRRKYAFQTSLLSSLFLLIFLGTYFFIRSDEALIAIIYGAIIIGFIAASFFIYLNYHRQMRIKKHEENWQDQMIQTTVIHTKFRDQKLTISHWWYLIPFAITVGIGVISVILYDDLPNKIPMNYNFAGEVTNWKDKSYGSVLMLPVLQASLVSLFLFINIVIARSKQQVSAENPEQSLQQNVIFRRRWSIFMYAALFGMIFMLTFLQFGSYFFDIHETFLITIPLIVSFATIIGVILLTISTGQGGSRINVTKEQAGTTIDRDDDIHWKLGQFYFNKNDPAVFIEKRFGVGWTMNFARPLGWIILTSIIALPLVIIFLFSEF